jgi:Malectin domain
VLPSTARLRVLLAVVAVILLAGSSALPAKRAAAATLVAQVNFQPAAAPVPAGYTADSGAAYADARGYGWVRQDSLSQATHVPLDLTPNTRDRNVEQNQLLDTLIHMQFPPANTSTTAVKTPGAWEYALPNGTYTVTVAVGDPLVGTDPESYTIHVEGVTAVANYVPSGANGSATRHKTATVTVQVTDGKLTIDAIGGTNTKLDYVNIVSGGQLDTTPPTGSISLAGTQTQPGTYANRATVSITSADSGGSGVASVTYSLDGGAATAYSGPFDVTTLGSHTLTATITDGAGNRTTTQPTTFSIVSSSQGGRIALQNLDPLPAADRMVFSRIGTLSNPPPANGVHDTGVLRISNTGSGPLVVSGLPITGPWQLVSPPTLPASVPAGGHLDLTLRFVATSGRVSTGSIDVQSDDPTKTDAVEQLAGYWQVVSEGGQEPTLAEVVSILGYKTQLTTGGQPLNQAGLERATGQEVLSPYWQRVDSTQPVTVQQIEAWHTMPNPATIYWTNKATGAQHAVFTTNGDFSQTFLPAISGTTTTPAAGTFTPDTTTFGFKVDSEYSDPNFNAQAADHTHGCPGPCGHHMRFWPLVDENGQVVPNTYLMTMDYSGINYDYQDNGYLISNIKPEPPGTLIARVDVGGTSSYTDTQGRVWSPDAGLFSPADAPAAGASSQPLDVGYTSDDQLYDTWRAAFPAGTPQANEVLTYTIPVGTAGKVDLTLLFAERVGADYGVGRRVMNITANGTTLSSGFDIYANAPYGNNALEVHFYRVPVSGGTLTLTFAATADQPSVAGIEVDRSR